MLDVVVGKVRSVRVPVMAGDMRSVTNDEVTEVSQESP